MELNRIYNTNCFAEDGLQSIPSKTIHLTITDPPYLHNKGGGKTHGTEGKSSIANSKMYNFDSPMMKKMSSFGKKEIIKLLNGIKRVMMKMNCYIFCNDTQIPYYLNWAIDNKYKYTILTWEKPLSILNRNRFSQNLEYIIRIYESGTGLNKLDIDKYPEKKEYYSKNRKINPLRGKEKVHPLQKPKEYIQGLIELSSNEGDIILDPFAGSGQTLLVAKELNRQYIGFELDENHYKIAKQRIKISQTSKWRCIICNKEMPEYIPEYCCDGRHCGCMGEPLEPPICSQKCWDELIKKQEYLKNY